MTTSDSKKCDTITALTTPITMDTIDGETRANKVATVELPIMHVTGAVVLEKAQEPVVPTHEICKEGRAYWQDGDPRRTRPNG